MGCSLGIIFMGLGIAEVNKESIPQELRDMSLIALDNVGTHPLICPHHVTPVFRVELSRELGGVHEVTEHDGELSPFGFGRGKGDGGWCDPGRLIFPSSRWGWR